MKPRRHNLFKKPFAMDEGNRQISVVTAKLIIGFFNETLTEEERDELDEWVCASDENMKIFEEMVELAESRNKSWAK